MMKKAITTWLFAMTYATLAPNHLYSDEISFAPVPFGVTSFGAAAHGDKIYLYGGHTGRPHSYSVDGISGKLLGLSTTDEDAQWEELSGGPKLQGLALVSDGEKLYRIGGLTIEPTTEGQSGPDSESKEEFSEDETQTKTGFRIFSVDSVAAYDAASGAWVTLPPLPEPRSSHDAVVLEDSIFVFGGWNLDGDSENWASHGFRLDLKSKSPSWTKVNMPEVKRRAMSLAGHDSKIYMIGGMSEDGDTLNEMAVYDIKKDSWTTATALPATGRLKGFGNSAMAVDGKIVCQSFDGEVRIFDPDSSKWSTWKTLEQRFFQRLVKLNEKQLAVVGGSNMSSGFTRRTELISMAAENTTDSNKDSEQKDLGPQLAKLKSADASAYHDIIEGMVAQNIDRSALVELLGGNVDPSPTDDRKRKLKKGWTAWSAVDENGIERPYQIYATEAIANGKKPSAVIMHLHGAVARPDFGSGLGAPAAVGYAGILWPGVADEQEYLIVCPLGRTDCVWWSDNGVDHVQAVIRDVRRTLPVPDRSIFCSGFSDGASGCYYLSMVNPEPFAGFIAMNGHPAVASAASGKQLYLGNMRRTPFIAAMTQNDSLYPTKSLLPHLNMAIKQNAPLWLVSYAKANHQPTYFADQKSTIINFIKNNKITKSVDRIRWQTSDISLGSVDGIEVLEIGATEWDVSEWEDLNLMTEPGRVSIGVELTSFGSTEVKRVVENSAASSAAIKPGDKLVMIGETPITGARDLRKALSSYEFGADFSCVVRRNDEDVSLSGQFPEFVSEPHYLREDLTAQVDCTLSSRGKPNVALSSRNVKRARIWLTPDFVSSNEIDVTWGSKDHATTTSDAIVPLTVKELLERYARNARATSYDRYVDVSE